MHDARCTLSLDIACINDVFVHFRAVYWNSLTRGELGRTPSATSHSLTLAKPHGSCTSVALNLESHACA